MRASLLSSFCSLLMSILMLSADVLHCNCATAAKSQETNAHACCNESTSRSGEGQRGESSAPCAHCGDCIQASDCSPKAAVTLTHTYGIELAQPPLMPGSTIELADFLVQKESQLRNLSLSPPGKILATSSSLAVHLSRWLI